MPQLHPSPAKKHLGSARSCAERVQCAPTGAARRASCLFSHGTDLLNRTFFLLLFFF